MHRWRGRRSAAPRESTPKARSADTRQQRTAPSAQLGGAPTWCCGRRTRSSRVPGAGISATLSLAGHQGCRDQRARVRLWPGFTLRDRNGRTCTGAGGWIAVTRGDRAVPGDAATSPWRPLVLGAAAGCRAGVQCSHGRRPTMSRPSSASGRTGTSRDRQAVPRRGRLPGRLPPGDRRRHGAPRLALSGGPVRPGGSEGAASPARSGRSSPHPTRRARTGLRRADRATGSRRPGRVRR